MADERIRRQIALLAARLMYERQETEYFTAKRKAARQMGVDHRFRPKDLPSNAEIREQILSLAQLYEGDSRRENLKAMRLTALRIMRLLDAFKPRLIGSTLTGHTRKGSDIDIHVFSNHVSAVTTVLDDAGYIYTVERKRVRKHNEERMFTHIHLTDRFNVELTLYDADKANYGFKSSITGKLIERATLPELLQLLAAEYPDEDLDATDIDTNNEIDRFAAFRSLLLPLEEVKQDPRWHPEGDALYHSLQVFELARDRVPYDEEFLLAALLHDVGKAIDRRDHIAAGLAALQGLISERTQYLIAHHMAAHDLADGTLGHRAAVRLRGDENFEDLQLLQELDRAGRQPGARVCSADQALDFIRRLEFDDTGWK
jgi:predicted nucleotidyltransferase